MGEMEKVIKSFEEQIASGYTCVDKMNKYAKDIDDNHPDWYNGKKYGVGTKDWCTIFFDWNFINALGEDRARVVLNRPKKSCGAGVRYSREYLKNIGRVGNEPKVGCAVYFGDLPYPRHIGFVYKVTDSMIYTYEGNCYVSKNVTGVKARSYKRTNTDILDYGYPVYDDGPAPEPDPKELDGYKVGNTYEVVCTDPLAVRKGPGTTYSKTGALEKGDKVQCEALRHDSSGNTWMQHKAGWSCAKYADIRYIDEPRKSGWIRDGGKWYYYEDGVKVVSDWVEYKGNLYYMGTDGAMYEGWKEADGAKRYFYPGEGHMAASEWIDGLWLDMDGAQRYAFTGKWKKNNRGWWFEDERGRYPKSRCMMINKIEYEFDDEGYLIEK